MYNRRHDKKFQDTGGLTFQIAHVKQSQRGRSGQIYWNQVRDLKPNFLSPLWSEMKNLSAYHQEDFLRNPKLTLMLILVPLLRELWLFKHRRVFFGTPCIIQNINHESPSPSAWPSKALHLTVALLKRESRNIFCRYSYFIHSASQVIYECLNFVSV